MKKSSAILASVLSLVQPGAGQVYAGRYAAGAAMWASGVLLAIALLGGVLGRSPLSLVVVLLAVLALHGSSAVHAYRAARARATPQRWFERWFVCLPLFVAVSLLVRPQLDQFRRLQSFYIPAGSMEPTLLIGDRMIVARDAYASTPVRRGDIICFASPERAGMVLVKRAVAVAGDRVAIRDKRLFVNGQEAREPWAQHLDPQVFPSHPLLSEAAARRDNMPEFTVPADQLFVLGDNRDFSHDSRYFGLVDRAAVVGAPLYLYWSQDRARIGRSLQPRGDV